ncbi:hypothetical protein GDO81_012623 [Engystomops pustulosus]|uniref:Endonuclease V n=1 Tax=Engystomops pustulosus TaxID=76066 RepID=A0AAV7AYL3_ENGPU|nr:hypothetical protein GDO81_012623 [Engystomops pustulosus]
MEAAEETESRAPGPAMDEEILQAWEREQGILKDRLITDNTETWQDSPQFRGLERVGGVDLSYVKEDDTTACASLIVLSYPDLEVLFVDGNGVLHHRGFGVACHLGILTGLPTIGVAKNLLQVDGLENNESHRGQAKELQMGGDFFYLKGTSGNVLGAALKSSQKSVKPVYISVGHKISLEAAVKLVHSCCKYRVPEPTRQADIRSREFCVKTTNEKQKPQD